jgi:glycosyltransferase involved in cell wall biosynthesis
VAVAVSAVIPTYRRADVVGRAVRSALAQTVSPLEVIVVDDEPSEAARVAVASVDDDRVRYVAHERNRGLSAARNTALARAQGEFVAFLDDDDEWDAAQAGASAHRNGARCRQRCGHEL